MNRDYLLALGERICQIEDAISQYIVAPSVAEKRDRLKFKLEDFETLLSQSEDWESEVLVHRYSKIINDFASFLSFPSRESYAQLQKSLADYIDYHNRVVYMEQDT